MVTCDEQLGLDETAGRNSTDSSSNRRPHMADPSMFTSGLVSPSYCRILRRELQEKRAALRKAKRHSLYRENFREPAATRNAAAWIEFEFGGPFLEFLAGTKPTNLPPWDWYNAGVHC